VCVCVFVCAQACVLRILIIEILMFHLYIIFMGIVLIQIHCKGRGRCFKINQHQKCMEAWHLIFFKYFNLYGDDSRKYTLKAVKDRL
jgi:hypothetical protein